MKKSIHFIKFTKTLLQQPRVKSYLIFVLFIQTALYILVLLQPLILRYLIDNIIPISDISSLGYWLAITISFVVFTRLYSAFVIHYIGYKIEILISAIINKQLGRNLIDMKNYNYKKHSIGKLLNVIGGEAYNAINIVFQFTSSWFTSTLTIITLFIIIMGISPISIIILVFASPIYIIAMFINNGRMQQAQRDANEWGDKASAMRRYFLDYKAPINIARAEKTFIHQNDERIDKSAKMAIKYWFWSHLSRESPQMVLNITTQVITFVAAIGVINNNMTLGAMLMIIAYVGIFAEALGHISHAVVRKNANIVTFERLNEILINEEEKDDFEKYTQANSNDFFIDIHNVDVMNPEGNKLFSIEDILISKAGLYQLIGSNESGKTTLLNLLTNISHSDGLQIHKDGYIRINKQLIENVAYCTMPQVFATTSVYNNILLDRQKPDNFDEIVQILNIDFLDKEIDPDNLNLSLGERAKVTLARTLVQNSKVMILDEPFVNIDIESTKNIVSYIKHLASEHIIIIVSHDETLADVRTHLLEIFDEKLILK